MNLKLEFILLNEKNSKNKNILEEKYFLENIKENQKNIKNKADLIIDLENLIIDKYSSKESIKKLEEIIGNIDNIKSNNYDKKIIFEDCGIYYGKISIRVLLNIIGKAILGKSGNTGFGLKYLKSIKEGKNKEEAILITKRKNLASKNSKNIPVHLSSISKKDFLIIEENAKEIYGIANIFNINTPLKGINKAFFFKINGTEYYHSLAWLFSQMGKKISDKKNSHRDGFNFLKLIKEGKNEKEAISILKEKEISDNKIKKNIDKILNQKTFIDDLETCQKMFISSIDNEVLNKRVFELIIGETSYGKITFEKLAILIGRKNGAKGSSCYYHGVKYLKERIKKEKGIKEENSLLLTKKIKEKKED